MGGKNSKEGGKEGSTASTSASTASSSAAASAPAPNRVVLNVYEPTQGSLMGGVYHSGVEVYDTEYMFAQGPSSLAGIFSHRPRQTEDANWTFKSSVVLGTTSLSRAEVRNLVTSMKNSGEWAGNSYHLTKKNCNHFSEAFLNQLGEGLAMPSWVNRGAKLLNSVGLGGVVGSKAANQAPKVDMDGRPLREEDRIALQLQPSNDEVVVDGLLDRMKVACLGSKPGQALMSIIPVDEKGARTKLNNKACISSDADEQLLLFLPFTRPVKLVSFLMRLSTKDLDSNPKQIKLFANQPNLDFSDVESVTPTHSLIVPRTPDEGRAFTKQEVKEGLWEMVVQLPATKFVNCTFLTIFVESNHGAEQTKLYGLTIVGRER